MSRNQTEINSSILDYIRDTFIQEDDFLRGLVADSLSRGFPQISIAPEQGKFLQFLLKAIKAENVIEIGSLFGYSAIVIARALPDGGKLTAVEMNPEYADYIRKQSRLAGLEDKIEVVCDDAVNFCKNFIPNKPLDFIFLDADKVNYTNYFNMLAPHLRSGGIIAADNALAFGYIAEDEIDESKKDDVEAMREFNIMLSTHPQFFSSLVQMGDGLAVGIKI